MCFSLIGLILCGVVNIILDENSQTTTQPAAPVAQVSLVAPPAKGK